MAALLKVTYIRLEMNNRLLALPILLDSYLLSTLLRIVASFRSFNVSPLVTACSISSTFDLYYLTASVPLRRSHLLYFH